MVSETWDVYHVYVRGGCQSVWVLLDGALDMKSRCGYLEDAYDVDKHMPVTSTNYGQTVITCHAKSSST